MRAACYVMPEKRAPCGYESESSKCMAVTHIHASRLRLARRRMELEQQLRTRIAADRCLCRSGGRLRLERPDQADLDGRRRARWQDHRFGQVTGNLRLPAIGGPGRLPVLVGVGGGGGDGLSEGDQAVRMSSP